MKKYLNSLQEAMEALKSGKKVIDELENQSYQMKDGFIIGDYGKSGCLVINDSVIFKDKLYTEEPEPLKFEVNKPYKTRSGHKAFLDSKTDNGMSFLCSDSSPILFTVNLNGKIRENDNCLLDIVGYWEEEK